MIFDGVCHLCHQAVHFIINRDKNDAFVFAAIQSQSAQALIKQHQLEHLGLDSFILIKNGQSYIRTDAALEVCQDLSGYLQVMRITKIFPARFRDYFYDLIATNRYQLFGKSDTCLIPTAELKSKFLD